VPVVVWLGVVLSGARQVDGRVEGRSQVLLVLGTLLGLSVHSSRASLVSLLPWPSLCRAVFLLTSGLLESL